MREGIIAGLEFLKPLDLYKTEKPYRLFVGKPPGAPNAPDTNVETITVPNIKIKDVRGKEDEYRLDEQGFQFVKHGHSFQDFTESNAVWQDYIPQIEKLIMDEIPLANRVFVYDWRIRREMNDEGEFSSSLISPSQLLDNSLILPPSLTVHGDATEFTTLKRVQVHFPDEAPELLKGRVRMIKSVPTGKMTALTKPTDIGMLGSFWRPLYHTVRNWPLVLCDGRTAPPEKLIAVDQVTRSFVGDIYYAFHDPSFLWHYKSGMGPDEAVLFKSWDTKEDSPSRACIHSSCDIPKNMLPATYELRMSIEARALVFSPE